MSVGDLVKFKTSWMRSQDQNAGVIIRVKGIAWCVVLWCNGKVTPEHADDLKNITHGDW